MADVEESWVRELERRYGVRPDFSRRLLPLLRSAAARSPTTAEWSAVLLVVADAYGTAVAADAQAPAVDETLRMLSLFNAELRKMDESLKVLSACLARVRTRVRRSVPGEPAH
jgi:hypothetical protein